MTFAKLTTIMLLSLALPGSPTARAAPPDAVELALEQAMHLYEGIWQGSIDLTSYHGELIMALQVRKEYRLVREGDEAVLLGRFEFGDHGGTRISTIRITLGNQHLNSEVVQEGVTTHYQGVIRDGEILWSETGKPEGQASTYRERFAERGRERLLFSQSRNRIQMEDGARRTLFTAGRFRYLGPPEAARPTENP